MERPFTRIVETVNTILVLRPRISFASKRPERVDTISHEPKDSHLRLSIVHVGYKRLIIATRNPTGDVYGLGGGVGRGLTDGPGLGVGVGRGVGVGDGAPLTAAKMSTRPHP